MNCGTLREEQDKKVIKTFYFKKYFSLKNAGIKSAYAFTRNKSRDVNFMKNDSNWILSFEDDFDSLNLLKWRPGQPWGEFHPDNPHQYYDAGEVKVKNGYLYLGGAYKPRKFKVKDSFITVPYAIGLVNSDISFSQKYGYFEIRSKNPSGPATWPAFWLTGVHRWPPEIDIFEMYGKKSGKTVHKQCYTIHYGKSNTRSRGYFSRKISLPGNTDTAFHIYACLWTPGFIKFYTDGHLSGYVRINKNLKKWLDDEMVVIINNSFDAPYLNYLPAGFSRNEFVVDYIRVFRRKNY
jgi:beta-glucanase (GH16 family)